MATLFLIDANVLITAHNTYYPIDSVPEFWDWIRDRADAGVIKMPIEIFEEIRDGGTDEEKDLLYAWIADDQIKKALVLAEEANPEHVKTCTNIGYAPDLTDSELEQVGRDPFLIAYAMASPVDRCVVTNEVSSTRRTRQNRRIPDVCASLNIKCCNTFSMTRALGFRTGWKSSQRA